MEKKLHGLYETFSTNKEIPATGEDENMDEFFTIQRLINNYPVEHPGTENLVRKINSTLSNISQIKEEISRLNQEIREKRDAYVQLVNKIMFAKSNDEIKQIENELDESDRQISKIITSVLEKRGQKELLESENKNLVNEDFELN